MNYYNETLSFLENSVDLKEETAELKEFNLGGYRTYTYSLYDDEFYYSINNTRSQIGNDYETNIITFYEEMHEIVSLVETSDYNGILFEPTGYNLSYNIAYLNGWELVYNDYLVYNNSEVAYVSTRDTSSIAQTFMEVELSMEQFPQESELLNPYSNIDFDNVNYSSFMSEMNSVKAMTNPVYYDENMATVKGVTYDVRTDLLDLLLADLPAIVATNLVDHMIVEEITFAGEDGLVDLIDCEITPDHRLCPSPE